MAPSTDHEVKASQIKGATGQHGRRLSPEAVSAVLASVGHKREAARIALAISSALYGAITDVMSAAVSSERTTSHCEVVAAYATMASANEAA